MEETPKKKKRILDKVLMGAVIGGAIGSVLGATIAPNEGKKTREEIKQAATEITQGSKTLLQKAKDFFRFKKKETPNSPMKQIPNEQIDISNEKR